MEFKGIGKVFDLTNERQYETIGQFWDEMAEQYGLENLQGLGYHWQGNEISYAIGFKSGDIPNWNVCISLPEDGWLTVQGKTEQLKALYDEIYQGGRITYEIETFCENGSCQIHYWRRHK